MLTKYPWFRTTRTNMEQITGTDGVRYVRWAGMPPRFAQIDVWVLRHGYNGPDAANRFPEKTEPGAVVTLAHIPFVLLRCSWLDGITWFAVREDAFTPLFRFVDALMWRLYLAEGHTLAWLLRRWKNDQFWGERARWTSLAGLHWLRKAKAAD